ncbi:unnamed protein product [Rhizophagus irregularis]|nr:unnamed protein product [Rhizophagus irregularis]
MTAATSARGRDTRGRYTKGIYYYKLDCFFSRVNKCYLSFNDNFIIDRDIRKTLKKPLSYRILESHISHRSLSIIKQYALDQTIDWQFSQLWIRHNPFDRPTSIQLSRFTSWKIKCSTHSLPTLDILNRNYPDLLKGFTSCFFCNDDIEDNHHLWTCPRVIDILCPIFKRFHDTFKILIVNNSDRYVALYEVAIKFCDIFNWTERSLMNITDNPHLHCLLLNLIPKEIIYPFKAAGIGKDRMKKILINFLYDLHKDIYEAVWKERSIMWKETKQRLNITKSSFRDYRRTHPNDNNRKRSRHDRNLNDPTMERGYRHPFNDSRRALDNHILWIYLTSSNFRHNLPWLSSLDVDLSSVSFYSHYNLDLFYF